MVEPSPFFGVPPDCALGAPGMIGGVHAEERAGPDLVDALDAALITLLARKVAALIMENAGGRP